MSDYYYDVVTVRGETRTHHDLGTQSPLSVGDVIPLEGTDWIIDRIEPGGEDGRALVTAKPVRYRLLLRHAAAWEDGGDFHDAARHRPDVGYHFTTGPAADWTLTARTLKRDAAGDPFIELVAKRDP